MVGRGGTVRVPGRVLSTRVASHNSGQSMVMPRRTRPVVVPTTVTRPLAIDRGMLGFGVPMACASRISAVTARPVLLEDMLGRVVHGTRSGSMVHAVTVLYGELFECAVGDGSGARRVK